MHDLITRFSVERLTLRPLDTGREIINEMQQAHEPKMEYRKQIARTRRSSVQQSQTDPTICTAGPENLWPETLTCSDHVQVSQKLRYLISVPRKLRQPFLKCINQYLASFYKSLGGL
jgi:hypothetical protein